MIKLKQVMFVMMGLMMTVAAHAEDAVAAGHADRGLTAIGAAIAIGLAVLGGAGAQGKTASAYLEGISRNPSAQDKMFVPMILGLALIESLVLFAFVIAFLVK